MARMKTLCAAFVTGFAVHVAAAATPAAGTPNTGAGLFHSCAVDASGGVVCWGDNTHGQLGVGAPSAALTPVVGLTNVASVSSLYEHSCAVRASGEVACWGSNSYGQLGDGRSINSSTPVVVAGLPPIAAVSAGGQHSCALSRAGAVFCWGGVDPFGSSSGGSLTPQPVAGLSSGIAAIATGYTQTCALTTAGAVLCWNLGAQPTPVSGLSSGVTAISGGYAHSCAIRAGAILCWGKNDVGQLGNGTTTDSAIPVQVSGVPSPAIAVAAGTDHTCALVPGGTAYCWGANDSGQLGNGSTVNSSVAVQVAANANFTAISVGAFHTCAVATSQALLCWGSNIDGDLGNVNPNDSLTPVQANRLFAGAIAVAASRFFTCVVTTTSNVMCFGDDRKGQLGVGRVLSSTTPVRVQGLPGPMVTVVTAGQNSQAVPGHSCALAAAGTVWCWGLNLEGQVGDGVPRFTSTATPVQVPGVSGAVAIGATADYTCAVTGAGEVQCWGFYPSIAGGLPTGVKAVATGSHHICVLKVDGRVFCWGSNGWSQLGADDSVFQSNVALEVHGIPFAPVDIAAGDNFNCVISPAGAVWCWGSNRLGELGDGSDPVTIFQKPTPVPVTGLGSGVKMISANNARVCALTSQDAVSCWGTNTRGALGTDTPVPWSAVPVQVQDMPAGIKHVSAGLLHNCATTGEGLAVCWGYNDTGQVGDGTIASRNRPKVVRREGSAGTLASNDWFLDLKPAVSKTIPAALKPAFLATTRGSTTQAKSDVTAQVQFRSTDVGNPIYVFGYAPASLVRAQGAALKDDAPNCILVQLSPNGVPLPASGTNLQNYTQNVTGSQQQTVTIIGNVNSANIAGSTFCVGTGASSSGAVAGANNQCVATVPPPGGQTQVCLPPSANTPAALSGLWWNSTESGWGIHFTQRGANVFAAWYTYDASGNPKWYVSTCAMNAGVTGTTGTCNGALYEVNGPTFFTPPFNTSLVHAVTAGNLQVNFQNADNASMTYSGVAGQTRTVAITRQPLSNGATSGVNYTDIWWGGQSQSGWGMGITQQASTMFLAWYVYDNSGKPMWYVATCTLNGTTCAGDLLRTTGPAFGPTFSASQVHAFTAGTVSVNFTDGNNATLSYTVNGVSASKTITRQLF